MRRAQGCERRAAPLCERCLILAQAASIRRGEPLFSENIRQCTPNRMTCMRRPKHHRPQARPVGYIMHSG
jgi:hypothetical protein